MMSKIKKIQIAALVLLGLSVLIWIFGQACIGGCSNDMLMLQSFGLYSSIVFVVILVIVKAFEMVKVRK